MASNHSTSADGSHAGTHIVVKHKPDQIEAALTYFREYGYVVFRNAFDSEVGERFWSDVERAIDSAPLTFSVYGKLYVAPDVPLEGKHLPRIIDIENHVQATRELMLGPTVRNFLGKYYSALPTCIQTLTYKFSSEQGAHSDLTLVAPPTAPDYDRNSLAAAWFAIERSTPANGALVIYPGSHRFTKRGIDQFKSYGDYMGYCDNVCRENGILPIAFEADPQDILFWHGDFVHAGGPILEQSYMPTRKSLVCHYANIPQTLASADTEFTRVYWGDASFFQRTRLLATDV